VGRAGTLGWGTGGEVGEVPECVGGLGE